jgi:regulator of replication initiation timing
MTQNHSYQQRHAAITSENEMLKAKITELEREIEVLDQLNDMTTQSATQENDQLKLEISQLKETHEVINQLDDLAMDSASAMGSAHEESDDE